MRAVFVSGLVVALAAPASAQEVEVYLAQGSGHQIEATVIGAPHLPADQFTLRDEHGLPAKPTAVRTWAESDQPIAVAVVYSGGEIWLGNDDFETDRTAVYPGALKGIEQGLDASDLRTIAPPGSQFLAVSYARGAHLRVAAEPIEKLAGSQLGLQWEYRGELGSDLVQGVTLALDELDKVRTPRKALIVLGDGNETDEEVAKVSLAQLKKRAVREHIAVTALVVKSALSDDRTDITRLTPRARTVALRDVGIELARSLRALDDRMYLTFPGDRLPWDGKEHDLIVAAGNVDTEPVTMVLGSAPAPVGSWWTWWRQLGAGVLLVGVVAGFARLASTRSS